MPDFYQTPDNLTRYFGDFIYDEFGMPVSGMITRVIGYSEIDGITAPAWRMTNLSVEIGDHLDELENDPQFWLAQNDGASLSVFDYSVSLFGFDLGETSDVRFKLDSENGTQDFLIDGGVGTNIIANGADSIFVREFNDTRIKLGDGDSYVQASDGQGIRILGGDGQDQIQVASSSDVYISLGSATTDGGSTPLNQTGVFGCDDFRIVGGDEIDFIYIDADYEYVDDKVVATNASTNGVVYGGDGDDRIVLIDGDDIRIFGGNGRDQFSITEGSANIFGGADEDSFIFDVDDTSYSVRIKDFDATEDIVAFYTEAGPVISAEAAFDMFMENAFERGANVFTTVEGNQIVLHDTSLDDLSVDNFYDSGPIG
ncbi:hypothetical protein GCM10008927_06770 [Amylibacter ulvae]|uniref:Uncharacterized protein n=1 Tax=Paramylibacter ulvae TaxID=1651968 RepID=A0ABQ3CWM3_9RHOB|nr:calcium-binding protein [Amylibacter ulvae]GHA44563.1 hypothetical protein GCM10008927_06770 [Amylibacter ulvae]